MIDQSEIALSSGVNALWDIGVEGEGVTVAVLDSGVRREDLGNRLVWAVDLTNDANPWNVTGDGASASHGTEMSKFILGFAPKAQIASIKVIDKDTPRMPERQVIIRGLEDCQQNHPEIKVANISLSVSPKLSTSTWCTPERLCSLCLKTNEVVSLGLVAVAAVGNWGSGLHKITCPGNATEALTVGALESRSWLNPTLAGKGHSGTSVSAALVSGGVALLCSALPDLEMSDIKEALAITVTRLDAPTNAVGHGKPHYYRAYKLLQHKRAGLAFDPIRALEHFEAGKSLEASGNIEESLQELEKAVALAPTSSTFHDTLGFAYLNQGHSERALELLREAVRLWFESVSAQFNLGTALQQVGYPEEAARHYWYARKLDPELDKLLDDLDQ